LAAASAGGNIYVLGGTDHLACTNIGQQTVERTVVNGDGSLGPWTAASAMLLPRSNHAVMSVGNRIYVLGGVNHCMLSDTTPSVEWALVNPDGSLGNWQTTSSMTTGRFQHGAVAVGNHIYAIGGGAAGPIAFNSVERTVVNPDGSLGPWQATSPLVFARYYLAVAAWGNYIYALGGGDPTSQFDSVERAEVQSDGSLGPWQLVSSMTTRRAGLRAVVLGDYLYALGGQDATIYSSVERAAIHGDGSLGSWEVVSDMTIPRAAHSAVVANGRIYALGGNRVEGSTRILLDSVEVWNPADVPPGGPPANLIRNSENGHYYEYVANPLTWDAARADAESRQYQGMAGYLATITSAAEKQFIESAFAVSTLPWLGGFQPSGSAEPDGGWQWVTGEPFDYTHWGAGEPNNDPNNFDGFEDKLMVRADGFWNDHHPGGSHPYIVEYDTDVSPPQPNLVVNGSFEEPVVSSGDIAIYYAGSSFSGWTVQEGSIDLIGYLFWQADDGVQSVDLTGNCSTGAIYQDLTTIPLQAYSLSFALAGNPGGDPAVKEMEVYWGTQLVDTLTFDVTGRTYTSMGWGQHQYSVVASTTTTRLLFRSLTGGCQGPALDSVSVIEAEPPVGGGSGQIVYMSGEILYRIDADGTNLVQLTGAVPNRGSYPKYSPDGSRIAFEGYNDGEPDRHLWIMNRDGSGATQISSLPLNHATLVWSPTGDRILFKSGSDAYTVKSDGSEQAQHIAAWPAYLAPTSWSPDGQCVLAESFINQQGLVWVVAPNGSNPVLLSAETGTGEGQAQWSPDGTRIALHAHAPNAEPFDGDIWVMDADGNNRQRLTVVPGEDESIYPRWSPDGTRIVFSSNRDATTWHLWTMNADGSAQVNITTDVGAQWSSWGHYPPLGSLPPVAYFRPTINSLSPSSLVAGGQAVTLIVSGAHFAPDSVVRWNGSDRPTSYLSDTQLEVQISAADIAAEGTASITVITPGLGGCDSEPLPIASPFTDLAVSAADIQFDPAISQPGQPVTLRAMVRNLGLIDAADVRVDFLEFNNLLDHTTIASLPAGQMAEVTIQTIYAEAGLQLISVAVDPENALAESNEENNVASKVLQVGDPGPSQAVMVIEVSPVATCRGQLLAISGQAFYDFAEISGTNDHPVQGGAVTVTILDPGTNAPLAVYSGAHTGVNGQFGQAVIAPLVDETYPVRVAVTDRTLTREMQTTLTVSGDCPEPTPVPPPDPGPGPGPRDPLVRDVYLFSEDIYFSDNNPDPGEPIQIVAHIHYLGLEPAENIPVTLYGIMPVNGVLARLVIGSAEVSFAGGGSGSQAVIKPWVANPQGAHVIQVVVEPPFEQFTQNDKATRIIVVGDLPRLELSKSVALLVDADGDNAFSPGDRLEYTLHYRNLGSNEAVNAVILDNYAEGLLATPTAISGNGVIVDGTLRWELGTLAADASGEVSYEVDILPEDQFPIGRTVIGNFALLTAEQTPAAADSVEVEVIVNVAPSEIVLTLDPAVVDENGSVTLQGQFVDPGAVDTHTVVISWGDGTPDTVLHLTAGERTFSAPHPYLDDNPSGTPSDVYAIRVTAGDGDQESGEASTTATVNNVEPQVSIVAPAAYSLHAVGTPVALQGSFTDVGSQDSHTVRWTLSSASLAAPIEVTTGLDAVYTFDTAGIYHITLAVTDDDTGRGTATTVADTEATIIVYDPNGGFVTGGGWIDSPAGAVPETTLTGKANLGFVAKYHNSGVLKGETQFQLKEADLNFHSASYDWLVIVGAKAVLHGSGTVNGTGGYGFLLAAIDERFAVNEDTDRFRIKIWDTNNGDAVVYDNQPGADLAADPVTALTKGNIALHQVAVAATTDAASPVIVVGNPPAELLAALLGQPTSNGPSRLLLPALTR
jgi:choice-of-anchor C domain-containing protein